MSKKTIAINFYIFLLSFLIFSCRTKDKIVGQINPKEDPPTPTHTHTFSSTYNYDSIDHWYPSTCGCNVVKSKEGHTYEKDKYACDTCPYIRDSELFDYTFSISSDSYARFTRGNLFFSTYSIGFEDNQYDFRTCCSTDQDSVDSKSFKAVKNGKSALTKNGDVGLFNYADIVAALALHKFQPNWGVLSEDEWKYLLKERNGADDKWGLAKIETDTDYYVTGIVLLPDSWSLPLGCSFTCGNTKGYSTNKYSILEWGKMQSRGAVFLPTVGFYRNNDESATFNNAGLYLTYIGTLYNAKLFGFFENSENINNNENLFFGQPVSDASYPVRMVERHRHTFKEDWSKDSKYHWYSANCGCEDLVKDKAEHNFGDSSDEWKIDLEATEQKPGSEHRECSVCGYREDREIPIKEHNHTFSNDYIFDSFNHWYPSTCGHNVVKGKSPHSFNIDGVCSICGYDEKAKYLTTGSLNGVFSVDGTGTKVKFSNGNLYYSGNKWDFEENQYDFRTWKNNYAVLNGKMTRTPEGNVGHFWWTKNAMKSYEKHYNDSDRQPNDSFFAKDNAEGWDVLTKDQWEYLLGDSKEREGKWGLGCVMTNYGVYVFGLFLLPDSWNFDNLPSSFSDDFPEFISGNKKTNFNKFTFDQWNKMEENGAVFLPITGIRYDDSDYNGDIGCYNSMAADPYEQIRVYYGVSCFYNTSTSYGHDSSYCLKILFSMFDPENATYARVEMSGRDNWASSVRLVKKVTL